LRRKIMILTTLVVLVGCAGVAYGALNTYTAKLGFSKGVGTKSKPVAISWTEKLTGANTISGDRAAPITDIKTTIYGMKFNPKGFPTCSETVIDTGPKFDAACPKGSEVGSGLVEALLGGTALYQQGTPCKTYLHIYNAGGGKEWYFFTTKSAADCGGLTTGQTAPYPGHVSFKHGSFISNVPLPPDVSTMVAGQTGLFGSLITETLKFNKNVRKVHGKKVAETESVGCKKGKRPYSVAFTATDGTTTETKTIPGSAKC
jgi:hypothetical protein